MLRDVPTIQEYYGVDPFLGGYDTQDAMSDELKNFRQKEANGTAERWANAVLYKLRHYDCKFRLYMGLSDAMSKHFRKESVDCLFIDGDHTYNGTKSDIQQFIPLMKPNALVVFDDYNFPGVKQALDEFVTLSGLQMTPVNRYNQYYVNMPAAGGSSVKLPV